MGSSSPASHSGSTSGSFPIGTTQPYMSQHLCPLRMRWATSTVSKRKASPVFAASALTRSTESISQSAHSPSRSAVCLIPNTVDLLAYSPLVPDRPTALALFPRRHLLAQQAFDRSRLAGLSTKPFV